MSANESAGAVGTTIFFKGSVRIVSWLPEVFDTVRPEHPWTSIRNRLQRQNPIRFHSVHYVTHGIRISEVRSPSFCYSARSFLFERIFLAKRHLRNTADFNRGTFCRLLLSAGSVTTDRANPLTFLARNLTRAISVRYAPRVALCHDVLSPIDIPPSSPATLPQEDSNVTHQCRPFVVIL